ncbi:hypothetical protein BDA99DRAFT_497362 [Phascolomyces articulosus]|uniref:Uncharacterized protein n=1 Tax=Phascolomyces articulosus TaxID=60185 RepID=A0AAD5PI95_9FUNG|nr:hypothetical protein BDA99DRAFT_497362 [Phascolomyces articulosus]
MNNSIMKESDDTLLVGWLNLKHILSLNFIFCYYNTSTVWLFLLHSQWRDNNKHRAGKKRHIVLV